MVKSVGNSKLTWKVNYKDEIDHAILARKAGNEGMARVCARRAAGIIIGEYLNRIGYSDLTNSVYDRLSLFNNLADLDPKYKAIANHFILKVNTDHILPVEADLVREVIWLAKSLLGED